jgi:hypothetical protein
MRKSIIGATISMCKLVVYGKLLYNRTLENFALYQNHTS